MKRLFGRLAPLLVTILSVAVPATAQEAIRVGWQTTWAIQGQLAMGLMHTPIGVHEGMALEFYGFSHGGPLNQAAIGGAVDVVLTADQPALVLLDRSDDFAIVARMMYNRVCLYAPAGGDLVEVSALAGMRVSGPVGAAAERVALDRISEEGVDLTSINFGNLDMAQQSALVLAAGKGAKSWPGVDALYGFDPVPAAFVAEGYARILDCDRVVSVVMMRKSTLLSQPQRAATFMCAFIAAWHQYAANTPLMNDLFLTESRLEVSHEVLDAAASLEPNFAIDNSQGFRFDFTDEDFTDFDSANRFLVERGILAAPVDVAANLNLGPLRSAMAAPSCEALIAAVPYPANE